MRIESGRQENCLRQEIEDGVHEYYHQIKEERLFVTRYSRCGRITTWDEPLSAVLMLNHPFIRLPDGTYCAVVGN